MPGKSPKTSIALLREKRREEIGLHFPSARDARQGIAPKFFRGNPYQEAPMKWEIMRTRNPEGRGFQRSGFRVPRWAKSAVSPMDSGLVAPKILKGSKTTDAKSFPNEVSHRCIV